MAEWSCSGLQSRLRRFDSGFSLHLCNLVATMKIICHRGFWSNSNKPNSIESFELAISNGFGIETDVRDFKGKLVISHDPPLGEEIYFEDLLTIKSISKFPLAINIKSDGLSFQVKDLMNRTQKYIKAFLS